MRYYKLMKNPGKCCALFSIDEPNDVWKCTPLEQYKDEPWHVMVQREEKPAAIANKLTKSYCTRHVTPIDRQGLQFFLKDMGLKEWSVVGQLDYNGGWSDIDDWVFVPCTEDGEIIRKQGGAFLYIDC